MWIIALYPIAWVVYTFAPAPLMAAPATGAASWYPHPLLDPALHVGCSGLAISVAVVAAVVGVGSFVVRNGRSRAMGRGSAPTLVPRLEAGL